MKISPSLVLISLLLSTGIAAQKIQLNGSTLVANKVTISVVQLQNKDVIRVTKDSLAKGADLPTYARVKNIDFKNGAIEMDVLSRLLPNATPADRGFIGIAFRVNEDNSKFECVYIRPTNGRADDQVRRNHSIQYFSFPDYDFSRLRKEAPEKYESYADMGLNEWVKLRIVVKDNLAKLYLNGNKEPSLIVNDLKHGPDLSGTIGLFVDGATEGYFRDLKVSKE